MMMDCKTFLAGYSAYRDGDVTWDEREAFEAHIDDCPSCARYDRVVARGTELVHDLPGLEVSEDFAARLQHRLYHVDEEMAAARRRSAAGPALATLSVAALVAAAAWVPLMQRGSAAAPVFHLPAVAVQPPSGERLVEALLPDPRHVEATGLTSQLARLGVAVYELPYHDLVFRKDGPLATLAAYADVAGSRPQAALE